MKILGYQNRKSFSIATERLIIIATLITVVILTSLVFSDYIIGTASIDDSTSTCTPIITGLIFMCI